MHNVINMVSNGEHFFFDENGVGTAAAALHPRYAAADPFPHIVLDNFLPTTFVQRLLDMFPQKDLASVARNGPNQNAKRGYRPDDLNDSPCRSYLYAFNSRPFLSFLENLTGIDGLIPDPYYLGGGLHEIERGGRLAIHADFNVHAKLNLLRRVNVLLFLNKDWDPGYGGHLELWDAGMSHCVVSIAPVFNRCVVFNTDRRSFHGHPDPLDCPQERTRRSIALYYYTVPPDRASNDAGQSSRTDWRSRPGMTEASNGSGLLRMLGRLFQGRRG
jgi:hypothetical protein